LLLYLNFIWIFLPYAKVQLLSHVPKLNKEKSNYYSHCSLLCTSTLGEIKPV